MSKFQLKLALRFFTKNKFDSFVNISGLGISLAVAMLIILYTKDEFSFDRFHQDPSSIYLIAIDVKMPDGSTVDQMGISSIVHGPRLSHSIPEIEWYTRVRQSYRYIKLNGEVYTQEIKEADTNFFSNFSFPILYGDRRTALSHPNSIVISEEMAVRHFGNANAIGETILVEDQGSFIPLSVSAVTKRCPQNSSIQFEAVMPIVVPAGQEEISANWVNVELTTFVKLVQNADPAQVASKIQSVFAVESKEIMDQIKKDGFEGKFNHTLLPLTETHLDTRYKTEQGLSGGSNPLYSYILSSIAIFLLFIACINFVNLTIARSAKRAKEIGIRKVVGGTRKQLIRQFLLESLLTCLVSFLIAMVIVWFALPLFNSFVNKQLSLSYLFDYRFVIYSLLLFLGTTVLAGFYPGLVLSSYQPVQTLHQSFKMSGKNYFQRTLIIFQFVLASIMIVATLTTYAQFDFLTSRELGYNSNDLVKIPKRNLSPKEAEVLKGQLIRDPSIVSASAHRRGKMVAKISGDSIYNFYFESVDSEFLDVLKLTLKEGRNLSLDYKTDSADAILVNESFVRMAGWKSPIGKQVELFPFNGKKMTVVGVVKNYNFQSLRERIQPQLFTFQLDSDDPAFKEIIVRIQPGSEARSLKHIEEVFRASFPFAPYTYEFNNEQIALNYDAESKWKEIIMASAIVTITISCVGLFALAVLMAEKRSKEIGIRKILGSSIRQIILLMLSGIFRLILIALIIAMPLAYYLTNRWLETYPYRIGSKLNLGILSFGSITVIVIVLLTVSFQFTKAASINPVKSIKKD